MAGILFLTLAVISSAHPLWLIFAILIHESGHFLTALALGWGFPRLQLNGMGLRLSYGSFHPVSHTLLVLISGCVVCLLCAVIPLFPSELRLYSMGLFAVNFLPVSSLDGGEILSFCLDSFFLPDKVYTITRTLSVITVMGLWLLCCAVHFKAGMNLTLLSVSVYLTVSTLADKGCN